MNLFPIGDVDGTSSHGHLYGVSYSFLEPNEGCDGSYLRNIQTLTMQDKLIDTYKRNNPFRQIEYRYKDILDKEFTPIKKFARLVEGGLTSFHVVDLSAGEYKGTIETPYSVALDYVGYYSTLSTSGAYYAFIWNGTDFMIGSVSTLSTTTITLTHVYGVTTVTAATVYPIYEVYVQPGGLDSFKTTVFNKEPTSTSHGWLRDGSVTFVTKYPVGV